MKVYLGIGTNLGDRGKNINEALKLIREHLGRINKVSSIYETEPWGFTSENDFLNMAVEAETRLKPSGLLGRILMIEVNMGRLRDEKKYTSRLIDIDILIYGENIIEAKTLVIPHPRMQERRFVLIPLNEIAGDTVHPKIGKTIRALLKECPDKSRVRKLKQNSKKQSDNQTIRHLDN
jgi:2-amino-4-hydroxy-6-hydroxymethyldihydropteridine diphosphokinase